MHIEVHSKVLSVRWKQIPLSGAEAPLVVAALMYGLKPVPFN